MYAGGWCETAGPIHQQKTDNWNSLLDRYSSDICGSGWKERNMGIISIINLHSAMLNVAADLIQTLLKDLLLETDRNLVSLTAPKHTGNPVNGGPKFNTYNWQ